MRTMKLSRLFITGVDSNQRWMLKWFQENFKKHNDAELVTFNFDTMFTDLDGWFKKPACMLHASMLADEICWIDVDCEVKGNLDGIWDHVEEGKISMVMDEPWTTRRGQNGKWYNSGVVAYKNPVPAVLYEWNRHIVQKLTQETGDQEVLHWMIGGDPLRELTHINPMPKIYNTLRLDLIDNTAPANPRIMHWTGHKGKDKIKEIMNG